MQIVTGRRGEPHVTSRQMQAVYRSFLGDFALLDIGEKLRAEAYSNDIVRVYDGVVSVQGIYAVIAYNQYDEVYIEPVSVGKKRIDTIVLHYTKDNALDVEDMQLDVLQGEEYTDNPIAPVVPEGGDAWEGTTDIQVPIYDVEVTNFGLTVIPHARMLTVIPTLDSIAERIPETVVTGVKGDSEVLYRDGDVNITKANIGLGNVDNTADTDKPISTATQTALNLKADLTYVDAKIAAAYHVGGSKTVAELTSALLIADNIGKVFNMSDSGVTTSDFVEGAGKSILEGDNVGICNVGTEESPVYKFDLLSGFVDLSAYATTSAVNAGLAGKVDKVTGKGLSTEDYTTTDKTKLAGISEGATQTVANPADTATETLSKLEVGGVVYDVPQGTTGATNLSELNDVNLSGTAEGDILEYDSTANKWKNSNALQGAKTATGNPITVTDAAPVNAVNLSMDLEPIQDLHGYDHPWVGGAGKNKLPMTVAGIKAANTSGTWSGNVYTLNGVTFTILTDADGNVTGIKVNGTSNVADTKFYFPIPTLNTSVDYILSGTPVGLTGKSSLFIQHDGRYDYDNGSGVTFTITNIYYVGILCVESQIISNQLFYPMIRLSTETDSSFAPYTNICPISGRSEVPIQRVGKNWIDTTLANLEIGTINGVSGLDETVNNRVRNKGMVSFPFDKIFDRGYVLTIPSGYAIAMRFYDADGKYIAPGDAYISWITQLPPTVYGKGVKYVKFVYRKTDNANITPNDIINVQYQLELGNTATEYEPYISKTYTIQLGDTVYGGTLNVKTGVLTFNKYYVTNKWSAYSSKATFENYERGQIRLSDSRLANTSLLTQSICNVNNYVNGHAWAGDSRGFVLSSDGKWVYQYLPVGLDTNTDIEVCYPLASPITIPLTPQQIKLLENINTLYTDYEGDTITIEYQPNNAIGGAVRAVEESYDHEFAVRPPLKKKAFSGTTDTDGSVTLINASDIPSGHKIIPLHITDMTIDGNAGTYFVEYEPYNSGDSVKGYCYFYMSGSQMFPVGKAITGNFYYYDLEV